MIFKRNYGKLIKKLRVEMTLMQSPAGGKGSTYENHGF